MKGATLTTLLCLSFNVKANPYDPNLILTEALSLNCLEVSDKTYADMGICNDPYPEVCSQYTDLGYSKTQSSVREVAISNLAQEIKNDPNFNKIYLTEEKMDEILKDPFKFQSAIILQKLKLKLNQTNELNSELATSYRPALKIYAKTLKNVYAEIYKKFAQQGISEEQVTKYIKNIQSRLSSLKASGVEFDPRFKTIDGKQPDFSAKVASIRIEDPAKTLSEYDLNMSEAKGEAKGEDLIKSMFQVCGADGMNRGAYFDPLAQSFVICPGDLLHAAEAGNLGELDLTIGHELSHSSDPLSTTRIKASNKEDESQYVYKESYKKFLDCIDTNYNDELRSLSSVISYVPNQGRLALEKKYEALQKDPSASADELFNVKRSLDRIDLRLKSYQNTHRHMTSIYGDHFTPAHSHAGELASDHFSAKAMAIKLRSLPKSQRLETMKKSLAGFLCRNNQEISRLRLGQMDDDGSHPTRELRMKLIMKNPKIRDALGCKPLGPTDRPWCDTK